jgi:hypothetical protein
MGSFPSNKRQRLQRRGTRFLVPRSSGTGHGTAALVHRPPPHGFGHATINSSSCGGSAITRPISFATPFHGAGRRLVGGRLGNFAVRCSEDQSHAHRFPSLRQIDGRAVGSPHCDSNGRTDMRVYCWRPFPGPTARRRDLLRATRCASWQLLLRTAPKDCLRK